MVNTFFVILLLWLACAICNAGLLLANIQAKCPLIAQESYREDLGVACLVGGWLAIALPIGVLVVLCVTGFAEHGWRLTRAIK